MIQEIVVEGRRSYASWYIVLATAKHLLRMRLQCGAHRFVTEVSRVAGESCGLNEIEERWLWH